MKDKTENVILYPLSTEKSIRMMEAENKLIFVVDARASKSDIKEAMRKMFNVKVENVNTLIDRDGRKRAYVRFSSDTPAIDIANNLGLM